MVDFGWSYPPGVSGTPYDEIQYCGICGLNEYKCQCPECEECSEWGNRSCAGKEGHLPQLEPKILWMEHLANEFGYQYGSESGQFTNDSVAEVIIAKMLYKGSTCGLVFYQVGDSERGQGIHVAGYCEGYEGDIPGHDLLYPFSMKEFWDIVQKADNEGIQVWNATHGCDKCAELYGGFDLDGDRCIGFDGHTPVHKDCPQCGGNGVRI